MLKECINLINKFGYNYVTKTTISYDTQHIITHILDLDFNFLYPSAFSARRVISYFKCTSNNSKQKAGDIVMSDDRSTDKGYILWFLIDYCNFIIDDIDSIALFDKQFGFESFTIVMMKKRQEAIIQHNDTKQLYYKQILNSAFGVEGQNNAKFDKISFNKSRLASIKQLNQCNKATRKLNDDTYNSNGEVIEESQYMVSESPRQFKYNMPLQEAVLTLDDSKFWYLNFVYNFLNKCIDMDRVHICNMDADSMYLAIVGSLIEGYKQGSKYFIKDQGFFDLHHKKWLPWNDCTVAEEKKFIDITTESQGENIVCLAPKCYSLYNRNQ
ncbi:MAG: hypothetical protein EZS28_000503 [Streblomastix strix]|uniref:DNA-directed DNA polymerase n=1 Tax=Streblomastix strix TaxID=222440 RepID=A0A5J4X9Y5_9EUKA|nr:MAG: hypothetical protein EZS28_000503 [Streblomastix strix]